MWPPNHQPTIIRLSRGAERVLRRAPARLTPERFAEEARRFVAWFQTLRRRPDLVLVHQHGLAHALLSAALPGDRPLTILTGHDHRQHFEQSEAAVLVTEARSAQVDRSRSASNTSALPRSGLGTTPSCKPWTSSTSSLSWATRSPAGRCSAGCSSASPQRAAAACAGRRAVAREVGSDLLGG